MSAMRLLTLLGYGLSMYGLGKGWDGAVYWAFGLGLIAGAYATMED